MLCEPITSTNDLRRCVVCEAGFNSHIPTKKACSADCIAEWQRIKARARAIAIRTVLDLPEKECACCASVFKPKSHKNVFCSAQCVKRVTRRRFKAKVAARNREARLSDIRGCPTCGKPFSPETYQQKYCSASCSAEQRKRERRARHVWRRDRSKVVECANCGESFSPRDARHVGCSVECGLKISSRVGANARRARLRGSFVERVDPIEVFERDKWRCQLCSIKTPKSLRGKSKPNAPHLDHIIPLARGGEHSYRNTQCLCRTCNLRKHAKPLGQMRLFG